MRCFYCHRPVSGPVLDAGGDVGPCHPGCFHRADEEDERLGLEAGRWRWAPDELVTLAEIRQSERKPPKRAEPERPARRTAA